jgi:hypothetical protein
MNSMFTALSCSSNALVNKGGGALYPLFFSVCWECFRRVRFLAEEKPVNVVEVVLRGVEQVNLPIEFFLEGRLL